MHDPWWCRSRYFDLAPAAPNRNQSNPVQIVVSNNNLASVGISYSTLSASKGRAITQVRDHLGRPKSHSSHCLAVPFLRNSSHPGFPVFRNVKKFLIRLFLFPFLFLFLSFHFKFLFFLSLFFPIYFFLLR